MSEKDAKKESIRFHNEQSNEVTCFLPDVPGAQQFSVNTEEMSKFLEKRLPKTNVDIYFSDTIRPLVALSRQSERLNKLFRTNRFPVYDGTFHIDLPGRTIIVMSPNDMAQEVVNRTKGIHEMSNAEVVDEVHNDLGAKAVTAVERVVEDRTILSEMVHNTPKYAGRALLGAGIVGAIGLGVSMFVISRQENGTAEAASPDKWSNLLASLTKAIVPGFVLGAAGGFLVGHVINTVDSVRLFKRQKAETRKRIINAVAENEHTPLINSVQVEDARDNDE